MNTNNDNYDFFIIHASADKDFAKRLYTLLDCNSRIFLDKQSLKLGDEWDQEIPHALANSRISLILLSTQIEEAYYARAEIQRAIALSRDKKQQHRVVPILINTDFEAIAASAYGLELKHSINVENPDDLTDLVNQLLNLLKIPDQPTPKPHPKLIPWQSSYLNRLIDTKSDMPITQLLQTLEDKPTPHILQHTLAIRNLFVPLTVTNPQARQAHSMGLASKTDTQTSLDENTPPAEISVWQALAQHQHLAVVGDPGSGKSTLLRYLAIRHAAESLSTDRTYEHEETVPEALIGAFPIFIELKPFYEQSLCPEAPLTKKYQPLHLQNALYAYLQESCLFTETQSAQQWIEKSDNTTPILWLLDGLDEIHITQTERNFLIESFADWAKLHKKHWICFSTRPYAYSGKTLPGFHRVDLLPLAHESIELFINLFSALMATALNPISSQSPKQIAQALCSLLKKTERKDLADLCQNPLLLTLTTALYCRFGEEKLPKDRAELYSQCLDILLLRWQEKLSKTGEAKYNITEDLVISEANLHQALDHLGFLAHLNLTEEIQTRELGDIQDSWIETSFAPHLDKKDLNIKKLFHYLNQKAGLLNARDDGRYAFVHRSFREFLAARFIQKDAKFADIKSLKIAFDSDPYWWREVLALAARIPSGQQVDLSLYHLLMPHGLSEVDLATVKTHHWQQAIVLANAELEGGSEILEQDSAQQVWHERLIHWLVRLVEQDTLNPQERAEAGSLLGRLGDPRPGIGIDSKTKLPDISWVEFEEGEFNSCKVDLKSDGGSFTVQPPFKLSRFLVTNAQFKSFIQDPEGHQNKLWWQGFENKYQEPQKSWCSEPNHPKTNISWHEALAFCRWLTTRGIEKELWLPGTEIRLPYEWEWQWAATEGDPIRQYPWGQDYLSSYANIAAIQSSNINRSRNHLNSNS